ncbi:GNAT family protein [Celeribacter halophilus]|jgi:RimJ/RimL family protein N-acetyltransferase|uniref:GNAT family protein n=1 Tax=Celeribacter halophilus TaxID=576117 RepID=A0AAW7XN51_9RHOB|nr:GNAT family protein [Celeribacter halophilus]MBU2890768.1 GNAT family N-acetyltransferase [Celeribacter halophilus]MDO6455480.1 GNAT family protein [Celeribacter halophilus]MDO6510067.1 GNAT family protein [Celeribacter halophilus]MDO6721684.1 GNAT family protein [Celeribacter halophilus]
MKMDIVKDRSAQPVTEAAAQQVIETDRFVMRAPRLSDAGLLNMYASDSRVARNSRSLPHPMPPGATEAFVARAIKADAPEKVWILDGSDYGLSEVLGVISLKPLDRDQCEVAFWVAPSFWGTGLARTALKAMVAANPLGSKTMFAEIFQDNQASARVVTAAGFEYIGDAETYCVARGAQVPTWTYLRKL